MTLLEKLKNARHRTEAKRALKSHCNDVLGIHYTDYDLSPDELRELISKLSEMHYDIIEKRKAQLDL